jgi:hypothetical protein
VQRTATHTLLMACLQALSLTSSAQHGDRAGINSGASCTLTSSARGDDGSKGVDGGNGSGSAVFAETQRCIVMDVLRTDFDGLDSSELTGEPAAAARQPDTASAAPATECINVAAQDALNEVTLPSRQPNLHTACVTTRS